MAKAKKGERLSCNVCGLVVVVDEACGCEATEIICCSEPMAEGKSTAKKKTAKAPVKASAKAAAKTAPAKGKPKAPAKTVAKVKPKTKK